jgi:hypothetical protein
MERCEGPDVVHVIHSIDPTAHEAPEDGNERDLRGSLSTAESGSAEDVDLDSCREAG